MAASLQQVFTQLDSNGDGVLSLEDIQFSVASLTDGAIDDDAVAAVFRKLDISNRGFVTFEDFRISHECLADLLSPSTPDVNTDVEFNYFSSADSRIEDDAVVESAVDTLCSLVEVNEDDTTVRLDTVRNALATSLNDGSPSVTNRIQKFVNDICPDDTDKDHIELIQFRQMAHDLISDLVHKRFDHLEGVPLIFEADVLDTDQPESVSPTERDRFMDRIARLKKDFDDQLNEQRHKFQAEKRAFKNVRTKLQTKLKASKAEVLSLKMEVCLATERLHAAKVEQENAERAHLEVLSQHQRTAAEEKLKLQRIIMDELDKGPKSKGKSPTKQVLKRQTDAKLKTLQLELARERKRHRTECVEYERQIAELRKTIADERMLWQSKLMRAAAERTPLQHRDTPSNSPIRSSPSSNSLAMELGMQTPSTTPKSSPTVSVVTSPRGACSATTRPKAGMYTLNPDGTPVNSPKLSVNTSPRLSVNTSPGKSEIPSPTVSVVTSPTFHPASPGSRQTASATGSPKSPRSSLSPRSPSHREAVEWIRRVRKVEKTLNDKSKAVSDKTKAVEQKLDHVHAQLKAARAAEVKAKVKFKAAEKSEAKAHARERALSRSEEKIARVRSAHAKRKRKVALKEARVDAALAEANKVKASASDARRNALEKQNECDKTMADIRETQAALKKKMKALDQRLREVRIKEEAAAAALQTAQAIESSLSDRQVSVKRTDAATRALADAKEKQAKAAKVLAAAKKKEAQATAKLQALKKKERQLKKTGSFKGRGAITQARKSADASPNLRRVRLRNLKARSALAKAAKVRVACIRFAFKCKIFVRDKRIAKLKEEQTRQVNRATAAEDQLRNLDIEHLQSLNELQQAHRHELEQLQGKYEVEKGHARQIRIGSAAAEQSSQETIKELSTELKALRERLKEIEQKRNGRKNYKFQTRHGIESKVQFKSDNGIRNKTQKRTQNKFQNRLNSTRAGPQSPHLRSPYPEHKTSVRDKLGYQSPSASPLSQTKTPRTRSPLDRTSEHKSPLRGKLGYRSPTGSAKTKGATKTPRTKSPVDRVSEQQTSARGKLSPRTSPGNSTFKGKGATKVPRARSPPDRTLEQKTPLHGKLGYRSPSASPFSKTKGSPKTSRTGSPLDRSSEQRVAARGRQSPGLSSGGSFSHTNETTKTTRKRSPQFEQKTSAGGQNGTRSPSRSKGKGANKSDRTSVFSELIRSLNTRKDFVRRQSSAVNPRAVGGQEMQSRAVIQARFLAKCSQIVDSFKGDYMDMGGDKRLTQHLATRVGWGRRGQTAPVGLWKGQSVQEERVVFSGSMEHVDPLPQKAVNKRKPTRKQHGPAVVMIVVTTSWVYEFNSPSEEKTKLRIKLRRRFKLSDISHIQICTSASDLVLLKVKTTGSAVYRTEQLRELVCWLHLLTDRTSMFNTGVASPRARKGYLPIQFVDAIRFKTSTGHMVRVSGNNKKPSQSQSQSQSPSGHEPGAKTKPASKASPKARIAAKTKTTSKTKHTSKTKQTGKSKRRASSDSHTESKSSSVLNSDEEPCEF